MRIIFLIAIVSLSGCFSFFDKTNDLRQGMSPKETTAVMGTQDGTEFVYGREIRLYLLKADGEKFLFYLVFKDGKLDSWFHGKDEYVHAKQSWEHPGEPLKQAIEVNAR